MLFILCNVNSELSDELFSLYQENELQELEQQLELRAKELKSQNAFLQAQVWHHGNTALRV